MMSKYLRRYYLYRFNSPTLRPFRRFLFGVALLSVGTLTFVAFVVAAWAQEEPSQPSAMVLPHNIARMYETGTLIAEKTCGSPPSSYYTCARVVRTPHGTLRFFVFNKESFPIYVYGLVLDEEDGGRWNGEREKWSGGTWKPTAIWEAERT
ncbi:hypothetical protein A2950_00515 [Candidatus Kaiserbacteria bacterium RIFCSPLOWO2_01_FULL_55_19]|uniref:Uncharacterized protein n=1 Tax=Candidatus Kaiserbacteria bacterium RIFCSPLOWO2_01_FULL_55_19 TaxID=1798516 RepID=A0A1F6ERY9_9BACT|nr:MAG: hypothetical protein A2950_00515 [Candidatus Kaiserbacteria bacterium RIFCSPLOWO2_01_FULL_55_19]